jgi:hypothetical protein
MFTLNEAPRKQGKATKPPKSICSNNDVFPAIFLPFIVIILAALLGFAYSPLVNDFWSGESILKSVMNEKVIQIKRVHWEPSRSVLEYIDLHPNEPVIFENTQVEEWRARRVWKPGYLKRIFSSENFVLKGAYVHERPVFGPYFDPSKPLNVDGVKDTIVRVNEHRTWSPSPEEFFSSLSESTGHWHYFTSKLSLLPPTLLLDIEPFDAILDLDPRSQEENMNIWIGQKGVSAACHYDGYDNINVQLYGRKQWNLYSPTNDSLLYLFPFLHPHHAQTQVDVESMEDQHHLYPKFKDAIRYEGVTNPGDAIYLPAMWFHNVLTMDTSININSWVKTPTSNILLKISKELPYDLSIYSAQLYLKYLLEFLNKSPSFTRHHITNPRYQRLFDTNQIDKNGAVKDIAQQCLSTKKGSEKEKIDSHHQSTSSKSSTREENQQYNYIHEEEAKKIHQLARKHANQFKIVPSDTLNIWLGNHMEYVLAYATQDPILAAGILNNCL